MAKKGPEDWLQKYYPTPAEEHPGSIKHSLRKWHGVRKEVLQEYGLRLYDMALCLEGSDEIVLTLSVNSCSLCRLYFDNGRCGGCPLLTSSGACYDDDQPYDIFDITGDPEPIIAALERALEEESATEKIEGYG